MVYSINEAIAVYLSELEEWKEMLDKLKERFGDDTLAMAATEEFSEIITLRHGIDAMEKVLKVDSRDRKGFYAQVGLGAPK